jgi:hypothetical protein
MPDLGPAYLAAGCVTAALAIILFVETIRPTLHQSAIWCLAPVILHGLAALAYIAISVGYFSHDTSPKTPACSANSAHTFNAAISAHPHNRGIGTVPCQSARDRSTNLL